VSCESKINSLQVGSL